jgi:hypothetical protein
LVCPNGAPTSTMDDLLASIHFIQASIPFFCCSGVEFSIIFSKSARDAMYRARLSKGGVVPHEKEVARRLTGRVPRIRVSGVRSNPFYDGPLGTEPNLLLRRRPSPGKPRLKGGASSYKSRKGRRLRSAAFWLYASRQGVIRDAYGKPSRTLLGIVRFVRGECCR